MRVTTTLYTLSNNAITTQKDMQDCSFYSAEFLSKFSTKQLAVNANGAG